MRQLAKNILAICMLSTAALSTPVRAANEADWRVASYPEGAELRYILPVVTDKDYPPAALRMGIEGTTVVRLQVDTAGQIMSCTVIQSAGAAELDSQACDIYRSRARFEPRGFEGPVTLDGPVAWRLGE